MFNWTRVLPACLGLAGLLATIGVANAGDAAADDRAVDKALDRLRAARPKDIPKAKAAALKMYEWGVQRAHWDGSAVTPNDVPDFYYSASEVALAPAPERTPPAPEPRPEEIEEPEDVMDKPVVYFECDTDLAFNFEVKSTVGDLTWMYPKPSRRVDGATAQWDDVKVYTDALATRNLRLPALHDVNKDHWAAFSRDGATTSVVVNGEHERFLFYEGTNRDLPEADVSRDADGNIIIRNYSCRPLHDVRLRLPVADKSDQWRAWYVRTIPAASGDAPHMVKLVDGSLVSLQDVRKPGTLAAETKAAGLTDAQSRVFERCWREEFLMAQDGVLTFRRDAKYLDEIVQLNLPGHISAESKRIGYVWVGKIDLSRQAEMDKLAASVAEGDKEAQAKLSKLGAAGIGAVRRLLADREMPLKKRLALATWLKAQAGK